MTFSLSKRLQKIDSSGIRKVFDLAKTLKTPIDMSIGQPHFDVFKNVKKAAIDSIRRGFNSYTPTQGDSELIELLKFHLKTTRKKEPEDLFIVSGVSGGLSLTFQTLLNPEDEVILPDPYFVSYKHLLNLYGAKPVYLDIYPDFTYDKEKLNKLITSKTKAIVINSPANPTGKIMSKREINDVIEVAKRNNLYLISDEIYEAFVYDIPQLPSPYGSYDKCILLNGFSKSLGATGWRIGYVAGPKEILQEMKKIQQYTFVCAPAPLQKALLAFLQKENQMELKKWVLEYQKKRDLFFSLIKDHFRIPLPQGAFYFFIPAPNDDGDAITEKAIKNNLLIIPGSVFSNRKTHFRVSFATSDENIKRGAQILTSIVNR